MFANLGPEDLARMHAVNVGGIHHCVRSALPHLLRTDHGRIVTFSSSLARMAGARGPLFNMTGVPVSRSVATATNGRARSSK